uniref:chaperone protein dnaJ 49-like n=1 Tax=Erigeron canadensis TaxID=72917 RepID=UPI001CB8D276|nr:chaperone protein dnaJ 49-like [Erigeron canadensis]
MAENDGETVVLILPSDRTVVEPLGVDRQISQREEEGRKACECMLITLSILLIILSFGGPIYLVYQQLYSYSLEKSDEYSHMLKTTDYGIEFYVYSLNMFNHNYPLGTFARDAIENKITGEYKHSIQKHCGDELKHRIRFPDFPTPFCDELDRMSKYST